MSLVASNLRFGYRKGRDVLNGVSFEAPAGAVTVVLGPNGAGKSTLLRLLLGVHAPWGGEVRLAGEPIRRMPAPVRARRLAYIAQRASVAFDFDAREVVRFGLFASPGGDDSRAVERLGLNGLDAARFASLSAGQQQRVMLARALAQLHGPAHGPRALLADEPLSAMDPRHVLTATEVLRELAAGGVAVVVVLHDLTAALRLADRAIVLGEDGRVAASGDAGAVLRPEVLGPIYAVTFAEARIDGRPAALVPAGAAAR